MYIVFEGIIGTGKSTQIEKLYKYLKERFPQREVVLTREPGGTPIAEAIRKVVQGQVFEEEMELVCEAYLYAAARAQSLRKVVKPVMEKGGIVIADRSVFSSLTNQAFGRKLGFEKVYGINQEAVGDIWPDAVLYLNLPIEQGLVRAFDKGGDKFEKLGKDFYQEVAKGYKMVSQHKDFKDRWINIDASGTPEEVFSRIIKALDIPLKNIK